MDSPDNVEAEPRHKASVDDCTDAMKQRVPPFAPVEEKKESHNENHSRQSSQRFSKKSSAKEEPRRELSQMERIRPAKKRTRTRTTRIEAGRKTK